MKKLFTLTWIILAYALSATAQDYKVVSVEHLPNDMTARKTILTEKIDGGKQCAVLRISTQNILEKQRDAFVFECDLGSTIRERRKDGGEICLWVSPGIKILKIKHQTLGNFILNIPEYLNNNVQSLNTYRINISGLKELPQEPLAFGSCQVVFKPNPESAVLFLNGDSIGPGEQTFRSIAGTYNWSYNHRLYHTKTGTIELKKGLVDTIFVTLSPSYGYLKLHNDNGLDNDVKVYMNGNRVGNLPFESDKLAMDTYDMMLERQGSPIATKKIEIKDRQTTTIGTKDFMSSFGEPTYSPITGGVELHSYPEEASIFIDGNPYGITPVVINNLLIGTHTVKLLKTGCSPVTQDIEIEENKTIMVSIKLPKACSVTIKTDRAGDGVYVDGKYAGVTPMTVEVPFGYRKLAVEREGHKIEKEYLLAPAEKEKTITFSFGQLVTVESERKNSKIYVNHRYVGKSPVEIYLPNGDHTIGAEHGWRTGATALSIKENQTLSNIFVETQITTPTNFLSRGYFFMTGNAAFLSKSNPVFGFNIGDIGSGGTSGWFLSLYANNQFDMFNVDYASAKKADENGYINGVLPLYSGDKRQFRASANIGGVLRLYGPLYFKVGAGAGIHRYCWKATNNQWVYLDPFNWASFEASAGLQLAIYNFVLNFDALAPLDDLTEGKKIVELRFGAGFCLKHKK